MCASERERERESKKSSPGGWPHRSLFFILLLEFGYSCTYNLYDFQSFWPGIHTVHLDIWELATLTTIPPIGLIISFIWEVRESCFSLSWIIQSVSLGSLLFIQKEGTSILSSDLDPSTLVRNVSVVCMWKWWGWNITFILDSPTIFSHSFVLLFPVWCQLFSMNRFTGKNWICY